MTLTLSRKPSSTCDSAWRTSRLTPARTRMSVIDTTAARLTGRLRQKLCQAVLSANLRFRNIIMVSARTVVSGNLPRIDRDDAAAEEVDDLTVVSRHHDGRASRVDAQKELHDLPRGGGVEVAGGFVRDDHARRMHQRPRDRHPLLLASGEVGGIRLLLAGETYRGQRLGSSRLEQTIRLAEPAQRGSTVPLHPAVRHELHLPQPHPHLPP